MARVNHFLFKRSNRIWYIVSEVDGKRRWKSTGTTLRSEALKIFLEREIEPEIPSPKPAPKSFREFLREFMEFAEGTFQRKTFELYRNVGLRFAMIVNSSDLNHITSKSWDDYAVTRSPQVSTTTLNIEQRTLKALLNKAVQWGYISVSPFARMKCVKPVELPPKYFTREELHHLLGLVEETWLRDAIIFAVSTGIRRGELVNLQWSDVDLSRRVIVIQNRQGFRVKGNKSRIVPLSSLACEVLSRLKKQSNCSLVFSQGGKQLWPNWVTELFRWYVKKAGLWEKGLHWHNLRSSFASWLVADGASIYAVSKLLGHSSVTLTQKYYARLSPETLHSTVDLIKLDIGKN